MSAKTAFVTGATGFVGSHLIDHLLADGFKVKALMRKNSNLRWLKDKNIELIEGSLSDKASLLTGVADVSHVYHLAGVLFGRNEDAFIQGNVVGTENLLNAVAESNPSLKRFLHLSSLAVCGPANELLPINETKVPEPLTWYGKSKLEAEKRVLTFKEQFPVTILRPSAVYGPRDYAIYEVFKTSKSGFNLKIGKSDKYASFIHVEDLARAIIIASQHENTISNTYFIANDHYNKQDDIAKYAIQALGKKEKTIRVPIKILSLAAHTFDFIGNLLQKDMVLNHQKLIELQQDYWICTNQKAKEDFNFSPKWTLEDGVKQTTHWYLENKWL